MRTPTFDLSLHYFDNRKGGLTDIARDRSCDITTLYYISIYTQLHMHRCTRNTVTYVGHDIMTRRAVCNTNILCNCGIYRVPPPTRSLPRTISRNIGSYIGGEKKAFRAIPVISGATRS